MGRSRNAAGWPHLDIGHPATLGQQFLFLVRFPLGADISRVNEHPTKTDAELLRQFVSRRAEDAFAELVKRHIGVVYSAACRETQGDLSAAHDVTQLVFIELVRKAASLQRHPTLAGWLYTCVRYVSANLRRTNHRRNMREDEARAMNELLRPDPNEAAWQEIRPALDDAMHELDERDKDAVLLRFFEGKSLREVGDALSLTENAARMRVERALEKLRKALGRRGVHSTGSALAGALALGVVAAPQALTASVTGSALATATLSAGSTAALFGAITMSKPAMVGLGALAIAAVSIPIWQQQRYAHVARENTALHKELNQVVELRKENQRLVDALQAADEGAGDLPAPAFDGSRFPSGAPSKSGSDVGGGVSEEPRRETWRQRFEAVYRLRSGEILRRLTQPYIPERAEYCRREFRNHRYPPDYLVLQQHAKGLRTLGAGFDHGRTFLVLRHDGNGLYTAGAGLDQGRTKLEDVLRYVVCLKRSEFYGAQELLDLVVPGDWVVRKGAGTESQLAALEPILREATGHNVHFEKQSGQVDVIVARGSFTPPKAGEKLDIFAENRDPDWRRSSRGDFQQFLEALGDCLNVPFVSEVQLQNDVTILWSCHTDADYSRAGSRRVDLLNKVLENIRQQTSLTFELQHRSGEKWSVTEQGKST